MAVKCLRSTPPLTFASTNREFSLVRCIRPSIQSRLSWSRFLPTRNSVEASERCVCRLSRQVGLLTSPTSRIRPLTYSAHSARLPQTRKESVNRQKWPLFRSNLKRMAGWYPRFNCSYSNYFSLIAFDEWYWASLDLVFLACFSLGAGGFNSERAGSFIGAVRFKMAT